MYPLAFRTCGFCGTLFSKSKQCVVNKRLPNRLSRHFSVTLPTERMKRIPPNSKDPSFSKGIDKIFQQSLGKSKSDGEKLDIADIIQPVFVKPKAVTKDDINVGEELTGKLDKALIMKKLTVFYRKPTTKALCKQRGMDDRIFTQAFINFRQFCVESELLPIELHITLSDIINGDGHVDDLFPYFYQHATTMFPHLTCLEELKTICDLSRPMNWYPEARGLTRRIIYHAGPTNSGKTYHAINDFFNASSGIYCGPLRMLASEIFNKSNAKLTPCDLVTGERQISVNEDGTTASHVACTVEMASTNSHFQVAVIDEIQMLADLSRGWAWTRALLGIAAEEVHICGDPSAIEIVRSLMLSTGDEFEIRRYERLTSLTVEQNPLKDYSQVQPGDAIVAFSKKDLYNVSRELEKRGVEAALIYGSLPPEVKMKQAENFNDPEHPCNVLVATDAIGMGLNLNIQRVIFHSMTKPTLLQNGEKMMEKLTVSHTKQIAGRAGRFNSQFEAGFVTTLEPKDLDYLKEMMISEIEPINQVGLNPTADQIELFAFHLPDAALSNLIDVFVSLSKIDDDNFFMCNLDDLKFLAETIQHIPIPIKQKYVLCCAPINNKEPFACSMLLKVARQFSNSEPCTYNWFCMHLGWPLRTPKTMSQLAHMETVHEVCDMYLWLAFRYPDQFPDNKMITDLQVELSEMISLGVINITKMLLKKDFKSKATQKEKEQKMAEVKLFAERKEKTSKALELTENWFENDNVDEEDKSEEEEEEPLLNDKEKVFQEMIENSKGAVSRQMLEKIYAQMEKEHSKGK